MLNGYPLSLQSGDKSKILIPQRIQPTTDDQSGWKILAQRQVKRRRLFTILSIAEILLKIPAYFAFIQ